MNAIAVFLTAPAVGIFRLVVVWVVRFNQRMPELWKLLEAKGRGHRVRDDPWSNLPQTRYLYDSVDFDEPEIRALKRALKRMHRRAIGTLLLFIAIVPAATLAWR